MTANESLEALKAAREAKAGKGWLGSWRSGKDTKDAEAKAEARAGARAEAKAAKDAKKAEKQAAKARNANLQSSAPPGADGVHLLSVLRCTNNILSPQCSSALSHPLVTDRSHNCFCLFCKKALRILLPELGTSSSHQPCHEHDSPPHMADGLSVTTCCLHLLLCNQSCVCPCWSCDGKFTGMSVPSTETAQSSCTRMFKNLWLLSYSLIFQDLTAASWTSLLTQHHIGERADDYRSGVSEYRASQS